MLVTKFHKKEPDMTPYLRIKQLERQQPTSYIKKITEMNQVLDKFDNMFSDIQQHKDVSRAEIILKQLFLYDITHSNSSLLN